MVKITRIIPYKVKNKLIHYLKNKLPEGTVESQKAKLALHWDNIEKDIPKIKLGLQHVQHARILPSRQDLLDLMPKKGVVAELGVNRGDFSRHILDRTEAVKLHLVDCWPDERYHSGLRKVVEEKFHNEIKNGRLEINYGLSTEVVNQFPDNYFDWIYIDTDHSYKVTKGELELYSKKMKPGGIMAGHDYIQGYWRDMVRYGVMEAVYEFCVNYNWEIIYLTTELEEHPSFAIRKI